MNVALGLSEGFDLNMGKSSFSDFCKYYPQVDSLESINMIKQEFGEKPRIWADLVFIYVYVSPRTGNKVGKIDMKSLVFTRMKKMEMKDIEELLNGHIPNHTLISKILKISRVYSVKLLSSLLNY